MRYWLSINDGKTYGPYDAAQLAALVQKGRMDQSSMLCAEGSTDWVSAPEALPELFGGTAPAPSPSPAPRTPRASADAGRRPAQRSAPEPSDDDDDAEEYDNRRARRARAYDDSRDPDDPSAPVFFLTRIVAALVDWLAGIARGGIFQTASRNAWGFGQFAFLAGAAALLAFAIIFAVRIDSLSTMGYALIVPVAAAVGQYAALRFVPTNELLVRNSPLRASGETFFQLLGFVLVLVAVGMAGLGIYYGVKFGEMVELAVPVVGAGILATVGFLFFSPTSLSLTIDPSATAGEDGLALVGTLIKALLASSRFIFGLLAIGGGVAAAVGTIWFLADAKDFRPPAVALAGASTLAVAAVYPVYAYVLAILYFVLVDALKGLISLGKKNDAPAA